MNYFIFLYTIVYIYFRQLKMSDNQLRPWEMQMLALVLLGVLYLVWRSMKQDGWYLSVNKEGLFGSSNALRITDAGVRSDREGLGNNEPPVFWNAGSMSDIMDAQSAGLSSEQLDSGAAFDGSMNNVPRALVGDDPLEGHLYKDGTGSSNVKFTMATEGLRSRGGYVGGLNKVLNNPY